MFKINRMILKPPFVGVTHKLMLPARATIHERMICPHPDGIAVFCVVDQDDPQSAEIAPRYLMIFNTNQPIGGPVEGQMNYLASLIQARMEAGKILIPGQQAQPRLVTDELHIFEFIPQDAAQLEASRGKVN